MLTYPPLKFLRKGEFLHFHKQTVMICQQFELPGPIAEALNGLPIAFAPLEGRLAKWKREPLTEELEALDTRRDKALSGLHLLASACTRHHNAAIVEAAEVLLHGMRHFGKKLTLLNYMAKTTVAEALVSQMNGEGPLADAAAILPLVKGWAQELQAANEAFETTWLNRSDIRAARPDKTFTELRPSVTGAYQLLADRIAAQQLLFPSVEMVQLIAELNELTEGYWRLVRGR
jgi:hypothetical protein